MLLTILERGPWKRDLAIAAGSAFVVTLATKFGEGMGETFSHMIRQGLVKRGKSEKGDVEGAEESEEASSGEFVEEGFEEVIEGEVGLFKPPGWDVYLPVALSQVGTVIRDDGKLFWSKGVVFGHKVVAIDLNSMQVVEDSEERFRKLPEEHPLNIPSWSEWREISETTPDGVLVAQVLWDTGPQFFGIVERNEGKVKVKPSKLNEARKDLHESFDDPKFYRIVPPVLAAKMELEI